MNPCGTTLNYMKEEEHIEHIVWFKFNKKYIVIVAIYIILCIHFRNIYYLTVNDAQHSFGHFIYFVFLIQIYIINVEHACCAC